MRLLVRFLRYFKVIFSDPRFRAVECLLWPFERWVRFTFLWKRSLFKGLFASCIFDVPDTYDPFAGPRKILTFAWLWLALFNLGLGRLYLTEWWLQTDLLGWVCLVRLESTMIDEVACRYRIISIVAWITHASWTKNIDVRLTDVTCGRIQVHLVHELVK